MKVPGFRDVYNAVDRTLAPRVEAAVQTRQAAEAAGMVVRIRSALGNRIDAISARVWHTVNLPTGTDINRLRRQIGELDREVRRLSLELAKQGRPDEERSDA